MKPGTHIQETGDDPSHPSFGMMLGLLPSDRSYWVVPGKLAAGVFPSHQDSAAAEARLRKMVTIGFDYLVDLTEEREVNRDGQVLHAYADDVCRYARELDRDVKCVRHPIVDMSVPTVDAMQVILDAIDEAVTTGRRAYIHCWGGFGRTGMVVGCYLVRHRMAVGTEALAMIRYLRRTDARSRSSSPQTDEQRQFVLDWMPGR